jgi:glycosyltransferase involved in cell wall biosynthesis
MLPFVSVCTPTFNRRPFIPTMLECFRHQTYPRDRMEWIIVDDGTDCVQDLILAANIAEINYVRLTERVPLGKKRNIMHQHVQGDYVVYMDDDDYYPPERVAHAVEMLEKNPWALCAGSSILHIYFKHLNQILEFGPYGQYHATAGTFAFRRKLLSDTAYQDDAALGEEKVFLKNYTVPLVQLDPFKVILVFSHPHNTFDKKKLLIDRNKTIVKDTSLNFDKFAMSPFMVRFFTDRMHVDLAGYAPGDPLFKPDVQAVNNAVFSIKMGDKTLIGPQIVDHLNQQQQFIDMLKSRIKQLSSNVPR